jgi:hypothetical protein
MSAAGSIGAVEPAFVPQKALPAVEQIETVACLTVVGPVVGLVVVRIEAPGTAVFQTMADPVVVRIEVRRAIVIQTMMGPAEVHIEAPGTIVLRTMVGPAEVHIEALEAVAPMFVEFAVA